MKTFRKIINDPVYGFIAIDDPVILRVMAHPWYQRLRRIQQMALAQWVYPGAVHTRLHHSLGAYHLMCLALEELDRKQANILPEEKLASKLAILLHDIGHGPFSHALEGKLLPGISHETIGLQMMQLLNEGMDGALSTAISIFTDTYPKTFLHQLVSGQLDVDRMDYLTRDSFFTGVSEGVVGYDRIIKMLTVHNNQLAVEGKAIYSIEKFLVARRLMYWQVYLHKTVLAAEQLLVNIIRRAKEIKADTHVGLQPFIHPPASFFENNNWLETFGALDDTDVMMAIKLWGNHPDRVLSMLCNMLLSRRLLKCHMQAQPIEDELFEAKSKIASKATGYTGHELNYFVFTGKAFNTTYSTADERIRIIFKDGTLKDISEVDNALIQQGLSATVGKHYICWMAAEDTLP